MKIYTIGRDLSCDIVINDNTDVVSRRHAVLNVSRGGKMALTDQSSNGTYINGIKMAQGQAVPVTRKDTVSFAHVATLDWNTIPKSKGWLKWLIIGLCLAALAILATLWLLRDRPLPPNNDMPVATDSIGVFTDTIPMDSIAADTLKMDSVKATEKPAKKVKRQKSNKEQPESKPEPRQKTDTTKPAPRPIGV